MPVVLLPFDAIKRPLAALCILDTYPQQRFDRIIDLVFWCKSRHDKTARDASRQVSNCGHTSIVYGLGRVCHHVKSR